MSPVQAGRDGSPLQGWPAVCWPGRAGWSAPLGGPGSSIGGAAEPLAPQARVQSAAGSSAEAPVVVQPSPAQLPRRAQQRVEAQ